MFIAQPSGRVLVQDICEHRPACFTRNGVFLSTRCLELLFSRALLEYEYTQNEVALFCVSLGHLLPLLLTGECLSWGGHLSLPLSYTELYLRWSLAVRYYPSFDVREAELKIDLSTMSTRYYYEQFLSRIAANGLAQVVFRQRECFQSGMESFKRFIHYRLKCFESCLPQPGRESPLAPGSYMDRASETTPMGCLVGHNQLLIAGRPSDITRYYNELAVESVPVAFWDAAGIPVRQAGAEYLEGSYLQAILQ
uniref:P0 protein n=1 Tax=Cereal yellow dwarf virus RPV-33WO TaxID=3073343 RepID=A0AA48I6U0_BYDVN|nr:P0 protein [Cereal yellow dwarf virus RPV-33WO]